MSRILGRHNEASQDGNWETAREYVTKIDVFFSVRLCLWASFAETCCLHVQGQAVYRGHVGNHQHNGADAKRPESSAAPLKKTQTSHSMSAEESLRAFIRMSLNKYQTPNYFLASVITNVTVLPRLHLLTTANFTVITYLLWLCESARSSSFCKHFISLYYLYRAFQ